MERFHDAGMDFDRTSARSLWSQSEPVIGDERYKFGTLVFFNGLGHMAIVADRKAIYHASSSKGITYSKFAGYWEKRIVGFRRFTPKQQIKPNSNPQNNIQPGIAQENNQKRVKQNQMPRPVIRAAAFSFFRLS
jgi:hypothetical protein